MGRGDTSYEDEGKHREPSELSAAFCDCHALQASFAANRNAINQSHNWLALPVVHLSKLLEKIRTKKRLAKMAREARHFVDEAVFGAYFFEQFGQMDNWKCKPVV